MIRTILTLLYLIVIVVGFVLAGEQYLDFTIGESLGILVVAAFLLLVCKLLSWAAPPKES